HDRRAAGILLPSLLGQGIDAGTCSRGKNCARCPEKGSHGDGSPLSSLTICPAEGGFQMSLCRFVLSIVALLLLQPRATATDLEKIDRSIGKEPAYESKPKYCLVIFGPEAKSRVWLVVDGHTLFTSGKNGELTKHGLSGDRYTVRVPGTSQDLT